MALKVQELPGGEGLINNAKLLQFKQNNFSIVQRIHKTPHINSRKIVIANFFDNC